MGKSEEEVVIQDELEREIETERQELLFPWRMIRPSATLVSVVEFQHVCAVGALEGWNHTIMLCICICILSFRDYIF